MSVRRSSRLMARLERATHEEAAVTTQGRAQASVSLAEQCRGATQTARAPQIPAGQVVEGEDEAEEVNKVINANPTHRRWTQMRTITSRKHNYNESQP
jgi:hypothetical protein